MRSSLETSRRHLFVQFPTWSVVLAGAGGVLGPVLAWMLLDVIMVIMPEFTLPSEVGSPLNLPVLLFTRRRSRRRRRSRFTVLRAGGT
jgi:hypothetical protein